MRLDPDVKALHDAAQARGDPPIEQIPIEVARKVRNDAKVLAAGPVEEVFQVEDRRIPGPAGEIPVRIYHSGPPGQARPGLVMYHGGAFVFGDLDTFASWARHYCNSTGAVVVDVDYRLAPEHKFPAAAEDCYAALCWVAAHAAELGIDPQRIGITGGSAGGTLTIVVCLLARERGGPQIALQIPKLPALTMESDPPYPSRQTYGDPYYGLSVTAQDYFARLYLDKPEDARDVRASPILAGDFSGLPRALVITAGFCPFRDEGADYAERLRQAGVPVEYVCIEGATHISMALLGVCQCARDAVSLISDRLQKWL